MRRVIALALLAAVTSLAGCGQASRQPKDAAARRETAAAASGHPAARGTPVWINNLQMVSASDGWALVWSSDPAGSGSPELEPAVTGDGGQTWAVVTPPAAQPLLVNGQALLYAESARQAWLAVNGGDSESTVVFVTSDGGRRWTESNAVAGSQSVAVSFSGTERGWLLVAAGAAMGQEPVSVYGTEDGGVTWSLLADRLPSVCDKTGMAFGPAETGWITSVCNGGYQVLVSRDGGLQWQAAALPLASSACLDGCAAGPLQLTGPTTFLAMSAYPAAAVLLVSTDAGASWRTEPMPAGAGPYPRVQFFGPADGVAVSAGPQGVIGEDFYLTTDGGSTWTVVPQGRQFGTDGAQFDFVSPQVGFTWIATTPGLYRTANSGRTWTAVVPDPG